MQLVTFLKDRADLVVIDPAVADDIEALSGVQRGELSILNRDDADRIWLVAYSVDDGPVAYYVWNRVERRPTFLFHHQPALSGLPARPDGALRHESHATASSCTGT